MLANDLNVSANDKSSKKYDVPLYFGYISRLGQKYSTRFGQDRIGCRLESNRVSETFLHILGGQISLDQRPSRGQVGPRSQEELERLGLQKTASSRKMKTLWWQAPRRRKLQYDD